MMAWGGKPKCNLGRAHTETGYDPSDRDASSMYFIYFVHTSHISSLYSLIISLLR